MALAALVSAPASAWAVLQLRAWHEGVPAQELFRVLRGAERPPPPDCPPGGPAPDAYSLCVAFFARDLDAGHRVEPADLRWRAYPGDYVPRDVPDPRGRTLAMPVFRDEMAQAAMVGP